MTSTMTNRSTWQRDGCRSRFGERLEEAARREMREEFGREITGIRRVGVIDNHFTVRGLRCHEIIFVHEPANG